MGVVGADTRVLATLPLFGSRIFLELGETEVLYVVLAYSESTSITMTADRQRLLLMKAALVPTLGTFYAAPSWSANDSGDSHCESVAPR